MRFKPPLDGANAYLADLAGGDYGAAYDRICPETAEDVSRGDFVAAMERRLSGAFAIEGFAADPLPDVHGGRAEVDVEIDYAEAETDDVTIHLTRDSGAWRVCPDADGLGS